MQAYGLPSGWNSLDLLELGDLLIVMRSSDLAEVSPTSLRLAASQLANNSAYSTILTEVRENPPVNLAFVHVRFIIRFGALSPAPCTTRPALVGWAQRREGRAPSL